MTIGGDVEGGGGIGDGGPESALLTRVAPAGLIDEEDRGVFDRLAQLGVGRCKSAGSTLADRVDRAGRDLGAEQLAAKLGGIAARDAVADRQERDRRLQARAEGAGPGPLRQLGPGAFAAARAAQGVGTMLGDGDRGRRQLGDLVAMGEAARSCSLRSKPCPQPGQRSGQWSMISSSSESATSSRVVPSWPGWPPCLRGLGDPLAWGRLAGGSADGGREEFWEFSRSFSSSRSILASSRVTWRS
jgi:hypothetical protein